MHFRFACLAVTFGLLTLQGFAQQSPADTLTLKGVEVTGRAPSPGLRSASPVQSMGEMQIKTLPGYTVADALRMFSGVTLRDYGGIGGLKTVMIRGLGANHTSVFVDGFPVNDVATGQTDLGHIPLDGIGSVSLTVGNAMQMCLPARARSAASLVEIETQIPYTAGKPNRYAAALKTGSFGTIHPSFSLSRRSGAKSGIGLTAGFISTRGNYPYTLHNGALPDTVIHRANGDLKSLDLGLHFDHMGDSSHLKIRSRFYTSEQGLPGAVVYYNPWSKQRLYNRLLTSGLQYRTHRNKTEWLTTAGFSSGFLLYTDPDYLSMEGGLNNYFNQSEIYISQAFATHLAAWLSLSVASDVVVAGLNTNQYQTHPWRLQSITSADLKGSFGRIETRFSLVNQLSTDRTTIQQKQRSSLSPSLSLIVPVLNHPFIRFRMMAGNSYRMPSFHELYYNLMGNVNLRPEKVNQLNAGFIGVFNLGKFEITWNTDAFAGRITDKILATPTQNLFVWSMRNIGRVNTSGVELHAGIQAPVNDRIHLLANAGYSLQRVTDASNKTATTYGDQLPYIPLQTFSSMAALEYRNISLGYYTLYNSQRYTMSENSAGNRLPAWWVHDVSLSWKHTRPAGNWLLKADISNLLGLQYEVIKGFPMSGRAFSITLTFSNS